MVKDCTTLARRSKDSRSVKTYRPRNREAGLDAIAFPLSNFWFPVIHVGNGYMNQQISVRTHPYATAQAEELTTLQVACNPGSDLNKSHSRVFLERRAKNLGFR